MSGSLSQLSIYAIQASSEGRETIRSPVGTFKPDLDIFISINNFDMLPMKIIGIFPAKFAFSSTSTSELEFCIDAHWRNYMRYYMRIWKFENKNVPKQNIYQLQLQRCHIKVAPRRRQLDVNKQNLKIMHSNQKHIFSRRENDQRHFCWSSTSFIACHSNFVFPCLLQNAKCIVSHVIALRIIATLLKKIGEVSLVKINWLCYDR